MTFIKKNEIFLLEEIVKKNFYSKYKDSILGIFWTIFKPLLMVILFTIIFSTLFGKNIENFPVYFFCGRSIFDFFTSVANTSMKTLKSNKNILQRTCVPKYIFILGSIISEFLNFIISLILLVGVMIVTNFTFYPTIPLSIIPIISLILMVSGIGLILSIACVYYSDIQHLWSVIALMIMYASAVFYPIEIIPETYRQYLILNPMFWIIDQFRCFVYYGTIPQTLYIFNSILLSLIIFVLGIIIFKKYENKITLKL